MRLPVISGEDVIKALKKKDFKIVRIKGSHVKLKKGDRVVIVPLHRELKRGTLLAILRQAGITRDELIRLLKDFEYID